VPSHAPPDDLIDLQCEYFQAESACLRLLACSEKLQAHPWWGQVLNRHEARTELLRVARARMGQ
jgi:hypothetical protein